MLYKNSYPIPKTLAVQATDNLDDIDSLDFRENLLKKIIPFSKNDRYDLAIRSSCTLEDDFTNNMAGHFDTFLGEMSSDDVFTNIKKIIAGIKEKSKGKMGIVIQNRISADYSGVLLSSNPVTYSKKQMFISYIHGMGNELVSGKDSGTDVVVTITEDDFLIDTKIDHALKEKIILLAQKSKKLEKRLNYPVDIEWTILGDDIYFLQCRPLASITKVSSGVFPVNNQNVSKIPKQLVSHDKINLRLTAQELNIFISDAYVCIRNLCSDDSPVIAIDNSNFCKGYSTVIIYPYRLSNKVIRSFVGDKKKVFESMTDCCRYGIKSFPKFNDLTSCLDGYFNLLADEYWISATIIQEIFDPLYTGVIQQLDKGYIIEITKGHFLTKGTVPVSQYIVSKSGTVLERLEVHQKTWLKIIEGHIIHCVCDDEDDPLVALNNEEIKHIIDSFSTILKIDS